MKFKHLKYTIYFWLYFGPIIVFAQHDLSKQEIFSLLKKTKFDTIKVDCYNELCWPIYSVTNIDSAIYYGTKAIELAEKIKDIKRLSVAHRRIGIAYINNADKIKSIYHQQKSYELAKQIGFKKGMANALNNIGVVYMNNNNFNLAIDYLLQSLKIREAINDSASLNTSYYNLAIVCQNNGDFNKARLYLNKSLLFAKRKNNTLDIISAYEAIGNVLFDEKKIDSALFYYKLSLTLNNKTDKPYQSSKCYSLISSAYYELKQYKTSISYCLHALEILKQIPNTKITGNVLGRLTVNYIQLNKLDSAKFYAEKAHDVLKFTSNYDARTVILDNLSNISKKQKKFEKAYEYLLLSYNYKDSAYANEKSIEITQKQMQFEFDKKTASDSIVHAEKEKLANAKIEVNDAKLKQEKIVRYVLIFGITGVLLFLLFIYRQFKRTKKQNKVIEEQKCEVEKQKLLVEEKQKEIIDSINYAKRLQNAILPNPKSISKHLNHFIVYKPKDIIAGDFYFYEDYNNHLFIAACDCTGHGIPGAMVSVVCSNALSKAIKEFQLTDPAKILSKTRELVIENFKASDETIMDGMDASIIVYNKTTKKITWSGANNPVYIIKNHVLEELKPDKQPIAFYDYSKDFTTIQIENTVNTTIYLITDGFADQFGGPKGKKYKYKTLKDFLVKNQSLSMNNQEIALVAEFDEWKGPLDQVDDVTIFGFNFK